MSQYRRRIPSIATTTAGLSVAVHDDVLSTGMVAAKFVGPGNIAVVLAFLLDRAVTVLHQWAPRPEAPDADLHTINGPDQAGDVSVASTFFSEVYPLYPGRNVITVVMGTPAPTAGYIAAEYNMFPGIINS